MTLFRNQFEALTRESGKFVRTLRQASYDSIVKEGIIPGKTEEWRFTPAGVFNTGEYSVDISDSMALPGDFKKTKCLPETSFFLVRSGTLEFESITKKDIPGGVAINSLSEILESDPGLGEKLEGLTKLPGQDGLHDLNLAFFSDGIHVKIEKNTIVERPLHFLFENSVEDDSFLVAPFLFIEVGENSNVNIIEEYSSHVNKKRWINSETAILISENSIINHVVLNDETEKSIQSSRLTVTVRENATYSGHTFNFGGQVLRQDSHIGLEGRGSSSIYNTLSLLDGKRHFGQYTWQSHTAPDTQSRQTVKMILKDKSTGVFNGRVMVRPQAQKADARQTNRNLLVSPTAVVHSNPQLEIDAEDIKCSHGSTTGELNEDAIFYLRSRGIDIESARALLVEGFALDLVDNMPVKAAAGRVTNSLNRWLEKRGK